MNGKQPRLSVVVLAYRSADSIAAFVDELIPAIESAEPDWEMILVGNYLKDSADRTPEVVRCIAESNPRIRFLAKVKQGMMGWDMRSGLETALGETLAVIDGDGQNPAEDIARAYRMLKESSLDMAKTYRVQRDDGWYRLVMSRVYNLVFSALFPGMNCRDINSKPKLMTREAYAALDLHSDGWFVDAEIMIQARRLGMSIGELPTEFKSLESRPSFVKPMTTLAFIANLIGYRLLEFRYCFNKPEAFRSKRKP
ncbi:MAG: glycosyltransferase family 2 protein [Candidatus Nitrohelix vancouverensis]|uniref:Glycosyltransferase family 2 protein n=1 Tax=Candidatus Nitrohelix vancouverensis TaxID=2705534 RepID=A0A7T0C1W4_9BACT|nr:MAG: glycosyltransferase family 2 protein [Candidatus Nitrohelix vancouverensis]